MSARSSSNLSHLSHQEIEHLAVIADFHRTANVADVLLIGIDAQFPIKRRRYVSDLDGIVFHEAAFLISRTVNTSARDAPSCYHQGESCRPVIASTVRVDLRGAAELAGHDHDCR